MMTCDCEGICDCLPIGDCWELLMPNLDRMIFELSLEFKPALDIEREESIALCTESRVQDEHIEMVERGVEILRNNCHAYSKVEVWLIDTNLDAMEGVVYLLYPRNGNQPILVDIDATDVVVAKQQEQA